MYYDKSDDALKIFHINPDTTAVLNFSKFDFTDSMKEYCYTDVELMVKLVLLQLLLLKRNNCNYFAFCLW